MNGFLQKIDAFLARIGEKISSFFEKKEKENSKPDIFDKIDAFFARFDGSFLIWSFFLSAALMLLIYVAKDVYPFGSSSVLVLDLNGQYVQFFAGLRRMIYGDGSLLYSFSRSLGGEFLGIYTYYLSSPLSYIVALFPEKNILEALLTIFVLKAGFSGLNFGIYLHHSKRPNKVMTVIFSVLYALSSYSIVMQHNTMWIDGMMLLPLLILGLERLIKERKPVLYTVSLALILLCNYYIGYMMCLFTLLYFFYYIVKESTKENRLPFLPALGRTAFYSLLAIGIAALLLLPAYYALTFGKTDFSTPDFSLKTKFDILDFIAKLFPGAYDTVRPEGLPWVYGGVLTLILSPLFFVANRISLKKKCAAGVFLVLLFVSMYLNPVDMVWHGFQAPNWLNFRYSFVFIFLLLTLAAEGSLYLKEIGYKPILIVSGILLALLILLQKLDLTYTSNGATKEYFDDLSGVWLSIACIGIYTFILMLLSEHSPFSKRTESLATVLALFVSAELLLNGCFYLRRQHDDVIISNYASYHNFYDVYSPAFEAIAKADGSFYRVDKAFQRSVCDSFVLGYNGLASSTSTLNASVVKFQHLLGMKANSHWTEATGTTPVSGAFLGVKYWVAEKKTEADPIYDYLREDGDAKYEGSVYLGFSPYTVTYQNPYALPLAFAAPSEIGQLNLSLPKDGTQEGGGDYKVGYAPWTIRDDFGTVCWSPFERMNAIYETLSGIDGLTVYDPLEATVTLTGDMTQKKDSIWSHVVYQTADKKASSRIRFTLSIDYTLDGEIIYCYFPTRYAREASVYLNNKAMGVTLYPANANAASVLSLGSFEEGETVTVELSLEKYGEFYLVENTPYFYTIDEEALSDATEVILPGGINFSVAEDDYFQGTITGREGALTVQTTIPYDEGWRITVDGETVTGYETLGALLAFDLPSAGEHTVTLRYLPKIYVIGLIISLSSLLLFAGIVTLILLRRKNPDLLSTGFAGKLTAILLPEGGRKERAVPEQAAEETETGADAAPAERPEPGRRISSPPPSEKSMKSQKRGKGKKRHGK